MNVEEALCKSFSNAMTTNHRTRKSLECEAGSKKGYLLMSGKLDDWLFVSKVRRTREVPLQFTAAMALSS